MPSPFSQGVQNADDMFDSSTIDAANISAMAKLAVAFDDILISTATLTTADVAFPVAHGLSATPDFVLFTGSNDSASIVEGMSWTANATTLTFLKVDTQDTAIVSYIAGVLT